MREPAKSTETTLGFFIKYGLLSIVWNDCFYEYSSEYKVLSTELLKVPNSGIDGILSFLLLLKIGGLTDV